MTALTEGKHSGEFILSEANYDRSREEITVVSGQVLTACMVVGKVTVGGKYKKYDNGAGTGEEVAAAIIFDDCDATDGDKKVAAIVRDCTVKAAMLDWGSSDATAISAGKADLLLLGIVVRE
jgi:NDP-sugar pyrophosphorylase family protein